MSLSLLILYFYKYKNSLRMLFLIAIFVISPLFIETLYLAAFDKIREIYPFIQIFIFSSFLFLAIKGFVYYPKKNKLFNGERKTYSGIYYFHNKSYFYRRKKDFQQHKKDQKNHQLMQPKFKNIVIENLLLSIIEGGICTLIIKICFLLSSV